MAPSDIYLNHAGTSWPKPAVVLEACRRATEVSPSQWPWRFTDALETIANFFGVANPDRLLLTPGCTSALAVGISDALIPSGMRVLTSHWEHHAVMRPLQKLASTGVRVEKIPTVENLRKGGAEQLLDLQWLEEELGKNDVAMVAITAACNVTGQLLPYEEVIRIAHNVGCIVMIDAAQVVGWQNLNFDTLGADLVAFGGHKGLQAPWGIGGLYLGDSARMSCVAATCDLPNKETMKVRPSYCDVGSVDQIALAGLHASVKMLAAMDTAAYLEQGREQIRKVRRILAGISGVRTYGDVEHGMPTLAFTVAGKTSSLLASQLGNHGLIVGSGLQCAPTAHEALATSETGLVRISVGVGQPEQQIEDAAERIAAALN